MNRSRFPSRRPSADRSRSRRRRRFLQSVGAAAGALVAGCVSGPGSSRTPTGSPTESPSGTEPGTGASPTADDAQPGCADLKRHPVTLKDERIHGYAEGSELTASRTQVRFGDEVTVRLRNTTHEKLTTGNERLYALQRATDDGWEHVLWVDDSSAGGTADVTVETVLVRVPFDSEGPPRHATVTHSTV